MERNEFQTKAVPLLASVVEVLKAQGDIRWWLDAGTCLGAIREGDFIAHDEDLDIGVLYRDDTLVASIRDGLIEAGFHQEHAFGPLNSGHEMSFKRDGVKVDVFFYYYDKERDVTWHSAWIGEKQLFLDFPAYLFGWTRPITFQGIECFVPDPPEKYLALRYGDWKSPNKNWSWSEDPLCLRSKLKEVEDKFNEWKNIHQPFELDWHKHKDGNFRFDDGQWNQAWDNVLNPYLPKDNALSILDIGGGSRCPLKGRGAYAACIEPLWDGYKEGLPPEWFQGIDGRGMPAEDLVDEFVGKFDFVLCWNVLDHCFDWRLILDNIAKYMKPTATFLLATDARPPCVGHPGVGDKDEFIEFLAKMFRIRTLKTDKADTHSRDIIAVLGKRI